MNKFQAREVTKARAYLAHSPDDATRALVARMLGNLIRCATTSKSAQALRAEALALGVINHPDFVS